MWMVTLLPPTLGPVYHGPEADSKHDRLQTGRVRRQDDHQVPQCAQLQRARGAVHEQHRIAFHAALPADIYREESQRFDAVAARQAQSNTLSPGL